MATKTPGNGSEAESYDTLLAIGVALILVLIAGLSAYWLNDGARLASAAEDLQSDRITRGQKTFTDQCTACHGQNGEGGAGPALNDRNLLKNTPDNILFSLIRSGVPNTQMPSWSVDFGGPLTDEDIRDVVALLRSWAPDAPEVSPKVRVADPARGAVLFASTCAICHGENGQGGKPGVPALNDAARLNQFDDTWYRDVIANGRPAKGMPTWGTVLSPDQLDDLVALIGSWREGKAIIPSFSATDLIARALFALDQGDPSSAKLHVEHALEVVAGAGAEVLKNAAAQLDAGDLIGAGETLKALQVQWPLGDPALGAVIYSANCAPCHGFQGEGGIGKPLANNAWLAGQTNAQLVEFVLTGRPGTAMAGFDGRLDETQIANVIAFLRLWQK